MWFKYLNKTEKLICFLFFISFSNSPFSPGADKHWPFHNMPLFSGSYIAFFLDKYAKHTLYIPEGFFKLCHLHIWYVLFNQQQRYLYFGHLSECTTWLEITRSCQIFTWIWDNLKRQTTNMKYMFFIFLPMLRHIVRTQILLKSCMFQNLT